MKQIRLVGVMMSVVLLFAPVHATDTTDELVKNGRFAVNVMEWNAHGAALIWDEEGAARVTVKNSGGRAWQTIRLEGGKRYAVSVRIKAESNPGNAQFVFESDVDGLIKYEYVAVGTLIDRQWRRIQGIYQPSGTAQADFAMYIRLGNGTQPCVFLFDDVSVTPLDTHMNSEVQALPCVEDAPYLEDIQNHWARDYIAFTQAREVTQRIADDRFEPEMAISRAEYIAWVAHALALKPVKYSNLFNDVTADTKQADLLQAAAAAKLIDPAMTPGKSLAPHKSINRQEAAAVIASAFRYAKKQLPDEGISHFEDSGEISPWAAGYVYSANSVGLITGVTASRFAPEAYLTRAMAAVTIQRLLEEIKQSAFYVDAITGDDGNSGRESAPLKTIEKVRDIVRTINKDMQNDIYVYLRGGTHVRTSTLEFNQADSGHNGYHVIYSGCYGQPAVISGGRRVTSWQLHDSEKNIYKAPSGGIETRQLYINGKRAVRARSEEGLANAGTDHGVLGLTTTDTYLADWKNISDVEMVFKAAWTNPRVGVKEVRVAGDKATVVMKQPAWLDASSKGMTAVTLPWYIENAYELLDDEGEWYLDRAQKMFYYKPLEGEDMSAANVIAPVIEELVTIQGENLDDKVHNITFKDITFAYTTWLRPSSDNGHVDAQNNLIRDVTTKESGDALCTAAVTVQQAHHINFEDCEFTGLGITALKMIDGVQHSIIRGNYFHDISGSAINVGEPTTLDDAIYNPQDERKVIRGNHVLNNYIHRIGIDYRSAAAVSTGFAADMDIMHNEIYDIPYSGLSLGYGWGAVKSSALKNMRVQYNYIHELMGQGLYDGGAVYTLGGTGGTTENPNIISHNYLKNQHAGNGVIYNDEGSTYWKSTNNVVEEHESMWGEDAVWALIWTSNITNIVHDNIYTTSRHYVNSGTNCSFSNIHVYEDANWPDEAMEIIRNAGLEPRYQHLLPIDDSLYRLTSATDIDLKSGQRQQLALKAFTDRGRPVDLTGAHVAYASGDTAVATVDADGTVTAIAGGRAVVTATATKDGVTKTVNCTIYVDDKFERLVIAEPVALTNVVAGHSKTISVAGVTAYGRTCALSSVQFKSSHSDIAMVEESGLITGVSPGTVTIEVTGVSGKTVKTTSLPINIIDYGDQSGTNYPAQGIPEVISDADNWYVDGAGTKTTTADSITISTPAGYANYIGKKFGDALLEFDMNIDATSGWPALVLRNQNEDGNISHTQNSLYLICFTPTDIELQRFDDAARTIIFANVPGMNIGGPGLPNTFVKYGITYRIQVGAINEDKGVRIILNVDGKNVLNFLDTTEGRISEPGYFGLYARSGSTTLSIGK